MNDDQELKEIEEGKPSFTESITELFLTAVFIGSAIWFIYRYFFM